MDIQGIWKLALEFLKNSSSSVNYNTIFSPLKALEIDGSDFIIECRDRMHLSFCEREKNEIVKALNASSPKRFNVVFVLKGQKKKKQSNSNFLKNSNFNPQLTFENFVVGTGNSFAYNVCLSVARQMENNGQNMFNPLFLYGGSGLGKTHLIQAIGNDIRERNDDKKVVYTQCETFLNEFISSLASKSFEPFRNKYRNCDYLLIDDIQFLENKEGTQEEFFHTFNSLYERGSQIVLTCDKPPSQLNSLEERLITRFSSGVLVDIQAPDFETRVAILSNMAKNNNIYFPDPVIEYIAENINSNVRELEGAFKKVLAYSHLQGNVSLNMTKQVLNDMIHPSEDKKLTPELIIQVIAAYYNISIDEIMSPRRNRSIAYPRMIAMYFLRTVLNLTLAKISEIFGKKDHTTARSACNKIDIIVKNDEQPLAREIEELKMRLSN